MRHFSNFPASPSMPLRSITTSPPLPPRYYGQERCHVCNRSMREWMTTSTFHRVTLTTPEMWTWADCGRCWPGPSAWPSPHTWLSWPLLLTPAWPSAPPYTRTVWVALRWYWDRVRTEIWCSSYLQETYWTCQTIRKGNNLAFKLHPGWVRGWQWWSSSAGPLHERSGRWAHPRHPPRCRQHHSGAHHPWASLPHPWAVTLQPPPVGVAPGIFSEVHHWGLWWYLLMFCCEKVLTGNYLMLILRSFSVWFANELLGEGVTEG